MFILPRMNWIHYTFHDAPPNYRNGINLGLVSGESGSRFWYDSIIRNEAYQSWLRHTTSRSSRVLIEPATTTEFLDLSPLFPFWIIMGMATLIGLLLILRRWPGLVAGIFLGCITTMCLYLFMITLQKNRKVYE